jgi:hypothetical protein
MMALRPVSDIGLVDATDVAGRSSEPTPTPTPARGRAGSRTARAPGETSSSRASTRRTTARPKSPRASTPVQRKPAAADLADENTTFVQFMVPDALQVRLADMTYALAPAHRKLQHQKTILGALVWRYVDPDDLQSLARLSELLDAFLADELAEAAAERKVGAHLPYVLKHRVDGVVLKLRRTRRPATAKTVMSALIWRYVDPADPEGLVELLGEYRAQIQPRPLPVIPGGDLEPQTSAE